MTTLSSRGLSRFYSCSQLCSIIHVLRYQYLFFIFPSVILPLVQLGCACLKSIVWDVGKAAWVSREPAADSKHIWLQCHRMCTQIFDCWTAHPEACLSSTQSRHNGAWERRRRERKKRRRFNSWDNHVLCSILPYGRAIESSMCFSSLQCNSVLCWTWALCYKIPFYFV